jgi:hypothetical protein
MHPIAKDTISPLAPLRNKKCRRCISIAFIGRLFSAILLKYEVVLNINLLLKELLP